MTLDRRCFLQVGLASVALPSLSPIASPVLTASEALAQAGYPHKPIQLIVGFAAGGPADNVARLLADELSKVMGQPIVIDNLAGAGGNLATARVTKAPPDGYTLLLAASGMITINPSLYERLPFDASRDL